MTRMTSARNTSIKGRSLVKFLKHRNWTRLDRAGELVMVAPSGARVLFRENADVTNNTAKQVCRLEGIGSLSDLAELVRKA